MKLIELLIGKKLRLITDLKTEVVLKIVDVKDKSTFNTRQITPDTPENDWWGESITTKDEHYIIYFENGAQREFSNLNDLSIVNDEKN